MVLAQRRFTADEWLDSPWNTTLSELADGIPVERMTMSGGHAEVAKALTRWIERAEVAGYGRWYAGPAGVILDPDGARNNIRKPGLCFFRRGRNPLQASKRIEGVPDLVIEILSPGNEADDLPGGSVWNSYRRFGVPQYWAVDPRERHVTKYVHLDGEFADAGQLHEMDILVCSLFPGIPLPVADLFRHFQSNHGASR